MVAHVARVDDEPLHGTLNAEVPLLHVRSYQSRIGHGECGLRIGRVDIRKFNRYLEYRNWNGGNPRAQMTGQTGLGDRSGQACVGALAVVGRANDVVIDVGDGITGAESGLSVSED